MLALLLTACGLSDDAIGRFLVVNTEIVNGVQQGLQPLEKKTAILPWRHGQGDGSYAYDGTVTGSGGWSGTVDVTGTGTAAGGGTILLYDLTLRLHAATVDDLTLDGSEAVSLQFQVEGDVVRAVDAYDGDLDVSGAASGRATCAYGSFGATDTPLTFQGTVNGRDLAGYSQ